MANGLISVPRNRGFYKHPVPDKCLKCKYASLSYEQVFLGLDDFHCEFYEVDFSREEGGYCEQLIKEEE